MTNTHRLGHHEVEARQHDGSDQSADALAFWIRGHGGQIDVLHKGEFEWDTDFAFLRLHDRFDRLVQPNFWVVKTEDHHFYCVYPDIFKNNYKSLEVIDDPAQEKAGVR